ncbi:hypothetical protein Q4555_11065 [Octadecabacter sp. 1_MG-2023]|uniref:hypothetical protein n=1 Tax=unclassified Octadecabacter TaxID=196158 RepID=UPI001C08E95D|nr:MULTISPECIES: hypothetical protein [unclassified Octadecabacter]MBU2993943.1 hypothetical protein [Octadecabacter sp. B2R22]MDO6735211.1 hypothetical protein [Octadecabacter sp. 1_MG-2023]
MKSFSLPLTLSTCALAVSILIAGEARSENHASVEIEIVGFVDESRIALVEELYDRFLAGPIPLRDDQASAGLSVAEGVIFYMGPEIVENGRFVPPEGVFISPQQLEVMSEKRFTDGMCRVENLTFLRDGRRLVLLVDDSNTPPPLELTHCVLIAFASALGAETHLINELSVSELSVLVDGLKRR